MEVSRALFFAGCCSLLGVLFYSSGYMMGRGLLHARLPKPACASRTPRLNPQLLMSHDGVSEAGNFFEEGVDVGSIAKRIARGSGVPEKALHAPSTKIEALKREPLLDAPSFPKRRVRPFDEPRGAAFYVAQ